MYIPVKLTISKAQQKKALKGGSIRLSKNAIESGASLVMVHPDNFKKLSKCKAGCQIMLAPGEIIETAERNGMMPQNIDMSGGSFLSSLLSGIQKVGSFLKNSGIASTVADTVQTLATPYVDSVVPGLSKNLRDVLKSTTGIGMKGSKKFNIMKGSSFRAN